MAWKEKRFVIHSEGMGFGQVKILLDKLTGVHYLFYCDGQGAGLTPLLDRNGKPVIADPDSVDADDE